RRVCLLTGALAAGVADGLIARAGAATGGEEKPAPGASAEPLAEWERELLESGQIPAAEVKDAASKEGQTPAESAAESAEGKSGEAAGA
ncbi:MAG: 30S ribosomal protein S2, partial [Actinomadura rubrobrunea]|nr:30S ribosomal protein S2 [Actinomadura rubrobrunea]